MVVAMVHLCHFHALASFVLGCGLTNDPPPFQPFLRQNSSPTPSVSTPETKSATPSVISQDSEQLTSETTANNKGGDEKVTNIVKKMEDLMSHNEELDISEVARRFETVKPDEIQPQISIDSGSGNFKVYEYSEIETTGCLNDDCFFNRLIAGDSSSPHFLLSSTFAEN